MDICDSMANVAVGIPVVDPWSRVPGLRLAPERLFSCAGQVAIVTGAATGIGSACAEALAGAGARVMLAGLGDLELVAGKLAADGAETSTFSCDVTDAAQLAALVEATLERWGRIDTVLANAGLALDEPDAADAMARMDRMFDVHVRALDAPMHCQVLRRSVWRAW